MSELGIYSDFPTFSHLVVRLQFEKTSLDTVALTARALRSLNGLEDHVEASVAKHSGSILVKRSFEVGIAEGLCFNYLDDVEVNRVSELAVKPASVDYIIYINYRYLREGRFANLLADRYIIRFSLSPSEVRLFQISGMRRTDPEALVWKIAELINREAVVSGHAGDIVSIEDYLDSQKN
jgi:hypothetical protein